MEFEQWEPVYASICADFGYDRDGDRQARDLLAELFVELAGEAAGEAAESPTAYASKLVEHAISGLDFGGRTVAVAGAAPGLEAELNLVTAADRVVAASDAAARILRAGHDLDCMVTDLDKTPETARALTAAGVPVFVHAHGDNADLVREHVPTFDVTAVVPTTQAAPVPPVRNVGGFTDGDRAAFVADALGADQLVFPGWEFDDPTVDAEKRRKLEWAERLLYWLERRRGDRFDVLDGRREALDDLFFDRQ